MLLSLPTIAACAAIASDPPEIAAKLEDAGKVDQPQKDDSDPKPEACKKLKGLCTENRLLKLLFVQALASDGSMNVSTNCDDLFVEQVIQKIWTFFVVCEKVTDFCDCLQWCN